MCKSWIPILLKLFGKEKYVYLSNLDNADAMKANAVYPWGVLNTIYF